MSDTETAFSRAGLGRALAHHRPWLLKQVRRWYRDRPWLAGCGLVQETLLAAIRHPERFLYRSPAGQRAWLGQVLWRKVASALRVKGCHKRDLDREQRIDAALADQLADSRPCPRGQLERAEQWAAIAAAVNTLRPPLRDVLRMRFWEGLTLAETASRLGYSVGWAWQLEARGLARVRAKLAASGLVPELQRRAS